MVAVRPSGICNTPLNPKINISAQNKRTSPNGQKLIITTSVASPVKRPNTLDALTLEAPLAKRLSISSLSNSNKTSSTSFKLLSQSADSGNLQSAINRVKNNLSQSCFADLRANRTDDIDTDLTCLNWLQEGDLLKGFNPGKKKGQSNDASKAENASSDLQNSPTDPLNAINEEDKSLRKPAYSFSTLIFMAIENAKDKRLPVKDIYQWIQDNFPYFQKAPIGWKNSVRHNLSLNKSFKKVDKEKCIGKGSLWTIDHEARAGLVQQLRKTTTYHSYPYSRTAYPHGCSKYFMKDRLLYKRDTHGRFIPNHDDTEFDVAAAMCSMSTPSSFQLQRRNNIDNGVVSAELLHMWRTYIEPYDEDMSPSHKSSPIDENKIQLTREKYSIEDFLDEVQNKLSFKSSTQDVKTTQRLNTSMDEDYEFCNSDDSDVDDDDEMNENMRRLVEKEKDDGLCDSGYSEEGTFKQSTMLDHSYSKSINSLVRPHSKRESKGVAALLHLANAATKELESLHKLDKSQDHDELTDKTNSFEITKDKGNESNSVVYFNDNSHVKKTGSENAALLGEVSA